MDWIAFVELTFQPPLMDLETAVAIAGGRIANPADLYDSILAEEFAIVEVWLARIQKIIDLLTEGAECERISAVLTRSPTLALRMRPLDDGSVVLLVPIGIIVRIRLLAALLLIYPDRDYVMRIVAPLTDDRPESDWELPPRLRPIFGEFIDDDHHWQLLGRFASEWAPEPELNLTLREVTWSAMTYAVMHEVAHVLRGHLGANLRKLQEDRLGHALPVSDQEAYAKPAILSIS